jgi:hypothetical protein
MCVSLGGATHREEGSMHTGYVMSAWVLLVCLVLGTPVTQRNDA